MNEVEQFCLNISSFNTKAAKLANLLRWGYLDAVKLPLEKPLRRSLVKKYINKYANDLGIQLCCNEITYDGNTYHKCGDNVIEVIDNDSDEEVKNEQNARWEAYNENRVINWFEVTNDSHHLYKIYLDNRDESRGILITFAEIIDNSYNPEAKCNCNVAKYESDFDSDFDSLFDSENEDKEKLNNGKNNDGDDGDDSNDDDFEE